MGVLTTKVLSLTHVCADPLFKHVVVVWVCTFTIILPLTCFNMKFSVYSLWQTNKDKEQTRLITENRERFEENLQHIRDYNKTVLLSTNSSNQDLLSREDFDIAITIITVSRDNVKVKHYEPNYLTQVVGRLLHILNTSSIQRTYGLFICNVDKNPDAYKEFNELPGMIPTFKRYSQKQTPLSDIFEKEKRDYVFCLEESLRMNPSYVLLIEDDGYPRLELLHVLEHVINNHIEKRNSILRPETSKRNVTYVKFYHPERLLGYLSLEVERIPELIGVSVVCGTLLLLFYMHCVVMWRSNKVIITWMICILFSGLVCSSIGRQNLLEFRRLSTYLYQVTPAASCCTPAMLFTRSGGKTVASHLKMKRCQRAYGKDVALEEIRKEEKLVALMVQPNVFHHIGMYSSLRNSMIDPFYV